MFYMFLSFYIKRIKKKVISTDEPNTLKMKAVASEIYLSPIVTECAHADEFQNILRGKNFALTVPVTNVHCQLFHCQTDQN